MVIAWIGIIIGFSAILLGNALEGGHLSSLVQPTAALIVFGGTFGATLLNSTLKEVKTAVQYALKAFTKGDPKYKELITQLIDIANVARKEGVLALDRLLNEIKNPFLANHLRHLVDGYDANVLRTLMEESIEHEEHVKTSAAKVFESAGGYCPTVGILGAVLGLIHVMANLSDSSKLGAGIAVAFVATVYGVGAANLVLLPLANKIKKNISSELTELRLISTALLGIQSGLNPRIIEDQLSTLLGDHHGAEEKQAKAAA